MSDSHRRLILKRRGSLDKPFKHMMSGHAPKRYEHGEGLGLVFSGANVNASKHPYIGQWMAHWTQACSSSPEDSQLHIADAVDGDVVDHFKGCDSLAIERVKSKEFKLLSMDMTQRYACGRKGKSSSAAGNVDLIQYATKSGEAVEDDLGASRMRRNVEIVYDEAIFSRKVTSHQLTESSTKWKNSASYNLQDLDVLALEFKHFPMFDINRKLETIMAYTKKSSNGTMFVKMMNEKLPHRESPITSSLVELAPGSWLGAKKKTVGTEKMMERYEVLQPDEADDMVGISSHEIHGCKCQNTNRAACISSCRLSYKDPAKTILTCMQHKPRCSSSSKFIASEAKPVSFSRNLGCSWKSLEDGSTLALRESPNDLLHLISTGEHNTEVKAGSSYKLLLGQKRLDRPVSSHIHHSPSKMQKCSMHDVSLPGSCRLKSVESGEGFHKFSSTVKFSLVADKLHKEMCHIEPTMGDSTFAITQVEGIAFPEIITLPTEENYGEGGSFENFTSDEERTHGDGIGAHLIEPHSASSVKTDTKYENAFHRSSSLPGETFSCPQKGVTYQNLRKSETSTPASPNQRGITRYIEAGLIDINAEHPASTKRTTSRTENMAGDYDVLHVKITDISSSSSLPKDTMSTEGCSRWVKRLQHNHSGILPLSTKRFKKGDASSNEMQMLCRVKNCNSLSYGEHRCMKEQHKSDKTMKLSKIVMPSSSDLEEASQSWIRRWCGNHHQASMTASIPGAFQPENFKKLPEKFEDKMFASIGAMALMGKAINNYRPCSFRRNEASVVWNT